LAKIEAIGWIVRLCHVGRPMGCTTPMRKSNTARCGYDSARSPSKLTWPWWPISANSNYLMSVRTLV